MASALPENAHLRRVNSAFSVCEQLQNSSCYTNFEGDKVVSNKFFGVTLERKKIGSLGNLENLEKIIPKLLNFPNTSPPPTTKATLKGSLCYVVVHSAIAEQPPTDR